MRTRRRCAFGGCGELRGLGTYIAVRFGPIFHKAGVCEMHWQSFISTPTLVYQDGGLVTPDDF